MNKCHLHKINLIIHTKIKVKQNWSENLCWDTWDEWVIDVRCAVACSIFLPTFMKNLQLCGILLKKIPIQWCFLYHLIPNVLTEFHNFDKETTRVQSVIEYHNAELPPPLGWAALMMWFKTHPRVIFEWLSILLELFALPF